LTQVDDVLNSIKFGSLSASNAAMDILGKSDRILFDTFIPSPWRKKVATISVALTYEDLEEKPIPRPENYPDRIDFTDLNSAQEITGEMIIAALSADLQAHGMEMQKNIIVSWTAMDISSVPTGPVN